MVWTFRKGQAYSLHMLISKEIQCGYNWEQHKSIKTPRSVVKQLGFTLNNLTLRREASSMFLHWTSSCGGEEAGGAARSPAEVKISFRTWSLDYWVTSLCESTEVHSVRITFIWSSDSECESALRKSACPHVGDRADHVVHSAPTTQASSGFGNIAGMTTWSSDFQLCVCPQWSIIKALTNDV